MFDFQKGLSWKQRYAAVLRVIPLYAACPKTGNILRTSKSAVETRSGHTKKKHAPEAYIMEAAAVASLRQAGISPESRQNLIPKLERASQLSHASLWGP